MKLYLALILTIQTINSFGCECFTTDLDTLIRSADYAFIGEAVRNINPDSQSYSLDNIGDGATTEFKVIRTIKGAIVDEMIVVDQRGVGGCSSRFIIGAKYLVFGYNHMTIPLTEEQRNQEYLIDEIFNGASDEYIEGNYSGSRISHDLGEVGKDIQVAFFERVDD